MEPCDIYHRNKQTPGRTMQPNHWTLKDDEYHLTVLGAVCTPDGRYLITRRVMTKAWAPGAWEVSGGGCRAGETSEQAIRREILEETGLDVKNASGGLVFTYHRENPGEGDNYFADVYRYVCDFAPEDVKIQKEEVLDWKLATAEEIEKIAKEGEFLHYDSIRRIFA